MNWMLGLSFSVLVLSTQYHYTLPIVLDTCIEPCIPHLFISIFYLPSITLPLHSVFIPRYLNAGSCLVIRKETV
ncbi:hypothetical protein GGR58DRAFT_465465 [Xylaria digitata]|nr:hypothetical protein GGR58DRAFT_465465 [Xylaria digitata]